MPEEYISECIAEEITDIPVPRRRTQSCPWSSVEGSWNPQRRTDQEVKNGVKVTTTVVGAIQVGQNPRHVCLTEGACLVARVRTSSSAADKGWRSVPDAILLGHRRAFQSWQGHPQCIGARIAGRLWMARFGSDIKCAANVVAEQQRSGLHLNQGVFPNHDLYQQLV